MREGRWLGHYRELHRRFGHTWVETIRGETTVNTMDPENFKHILISDFGSFGKPRAYRNWTLPLMGNTVLNDGPHHRVIRALIKPVFSRAETYSNRLDFFANKFLDLLPPKGTSFNITPFCKRLFLDFSTDFIFGHSINSLGDEENAREFIDAFKKALHYFGKRRDAGWVGFTYAWNRDYIQACKIVHNFIDEQVAKALLETKKMTVTSESYTVIEELAKHIKDPIELRSQVLGIFIPAVDTPSGALLHTLFELARQPHRWHRLRQIALSAEEPLSFRQLRSAEFAEIRHVVLETLRIYTLMGLRYAVRDCVLPRGGGKDQDQPMFVAKGTKFYIVLTAWHREPSIWGEDAEKYRPERWKDHEQRGDLEFIPFIAGFRRCPAADTVPVQTAYLLVKLLQKYEGIKNEDPEEQYYEQWGMTLESRNGVRISFE